MKQALKRLRDTSTLMEPLCRLLRATGLIRVGLWQHLSFRGIADFTVAGQKIKMHHFGAGLENSLFWAGYGEDWEATTLLVWERLAIDHAVIYDVGANTGLFSLAAKAANPGAHVHAFEPLPKIAARLAANSALNGMEIELHIVAVSDRQGTAEIRLAQTEHEYSASMEHMEWMDTIDAHSIEVPVIQLADVVAQNQRSPGLIKLDIERHEPAALRGLWPGLADRPLPILVIEILDDGCAAAIAKEIAGRGYRSFAIRECDSMKEEELRFVPGAMNWLLLPEQADGFAAEILAQGGCDHATLLQCRPTAAAQAGR